MASSFETTVRLFVDRHASPAAAKALLVDRARSGLAEFMSRQDVKPMVTLEVDGRPARSEDEVRPFGIIVYTFSRMREIVSFAMRTLEQLSPVRSGRYQKSWIVLAGMRQVGMDELPANAPIMITNTQPYHRKIHTGAEGFVAYANPGIVEKARQILLKRYRGRIKVWIEFTKLHGGYKLKKPPKTGQAVTYPTLVIEPA